MSNTSKPTALIIDDGEEVSALRTQLELSGQIEARVVYPEDVVLDDLVGADLVLVDYQLDQWNEAQAVPVSRSPRDGLALAAVLRRQIHDRERESPTAFGILTANIEKLAAPLPPENREHVLARMSNLEWVFRKAKVGDPTRLGEQITALAAAVRRLPQQWPRKNSHEAMRLLAQILALDHDHEAAAQQLEDVSNCIPPIHELSEWSHGLAVVRWLLQRILPYPCFLWSSHYIAARMRVDFQWFCETLEVSQALREWLGAASYTGMLADFSGRRWWRAKVEQLLWESTGQQSFAVERIWATLSSVIGGDVKPSDPPDHPLVCVNSDYEALDQFSAIQDAVRIRPDDWPMYADQPWTATELARSESRLGALVITDDKGKLDGRGG